MKHYSLNKLNSLVRVVEVDPAKYIIQVVKADSVRKPLRDFKHTYHNRYGYKEIFKINGASTFDMADPKSLFYGKLFYDGGHSLGEHSEKMTEFYFTKDHRLDVEGSTSFKVPANPSFGQSGLFALTVNGKKNTYNMKNYAHYSTKTARAGMGQKADGIVGFVRADNLTGNEFADLMLELGFINSVNFDGGGSAQMQIGDTHYGSTRLLGTAIVVLEKEEPKEEEHIVDRKLPIVVIDPGHGGADPGAVSNGFGLREKDLTLTISKHIQYFITRDYIVDFRLTRDTDKTMDLLERSRFANQIDADYFVSVHINAGGGTGYEDFIHLNLSDASKTATMRDIVHGEIEKVLIKYNIRNRGKKKANFAVLRETNMSAVLTETLFIDHLEDQKLLKNEQFLKDIAEAHSHGIAKALGLAKKVVPAPVVPAPNPMVGGQPGLHRIIVDGTQIGAWRDMSYLLRNVEKSIESGAKDITIQKA